MCRKKLWLIIGQFSLAKVERRILIRSLRMIPANFRTIFTSPETRTNFLPESENRMIVASFVSTQYQHVTEGVMAHNWSIFACDSRRPHNNSLARVIPCEFPDDLHLSRNWNHRATWQWKPYYRSFIRLDTIPACEWRTDRRTDTAISLSLIHIWRCRRRG